MLPQIHSMDISPATTASIITSMVISIIVPVGLCLYFWRKEGIHLRTVFIGAGVWLVVTQLLEKTVHLFVIQNTQILTQPFLFALYGALVAGIFEEGGRYIVFRQWLKDKRSWKDALAYGIGHGGMESILLGLLSGIPLLIFANLFSGGGISKLEGTIPPEAIEALKTALYGPSALFLLGGLERLLAICIQIALSFVVLYGIASGKIRMLVFAVLLHALIDLPAALYQMEKINLLSVYIIVTAAALLSLGLIRTIQKAFLKLEPDKPKKKNKTHTS